MAGLLVASLLCVSGGWSVDRPGRSQRWRGTSGGGGGGGSSSSSHGDGSSGSGLLWDPSSNICLLTIMTQERRASLHRLLATWDGYISIALLVDDYDAAVAEGLGVLRYRGKYPPATERITLSIVEDKGYRAPLNRFPYNVLRNTALRGCTADYVLAADVDFVPFPPRPSANLRRSLRELDVREGASNVLVLAAFEAMDHAVGPSDAQDSAQHARRQAHATLGAAMPEGDQSQLHDKGFVAAGSRSGIAAAAPGRRLSALESNSSSPSGLGPSEDRDISRYLEGRDISGLSGLGPSEDQYLDKAKLLSSVRANTIVGFASREYDAGHRCDHVHTFLQATAPYEVQYEFGCEPYTVIPRCARCPPDDTRPDERAPS